MLLPEGPRREVALREGRLRAAVPIAIPVVQPGPLMGPRRALRPEPEEAAGRAVPAGSRREHLKARARPSAAVARKVRAPQATEEAEAMAAQRLAQAERLVPPALPAAEAAAVREAQQAPGVLGAQPPVAPEAPDVVVGRQPVAESAEVAARPREAAAVQGGAEAVPRRAAGPASAAVRLRGAEVAAPDAEEAPLRAAQAGALAAAEEPHRVARDEEVLLLAAAWAELPSTRLRGGRLAPSARARSAHARGGSRTARP